MTLKKDAEMLMVFSTSERRRAVMSVMENYNELFTKAVTTTSPKYIVLTGQSGIFWSAPVR